MHLLLSRTPALRHADGRTVALAPHDAALYAWLAIEGATPRERLATLLWPASDTEAALNSLRQKVFRLKKRHGDLLVAERFVVSLREGLTHDLDASSGVLEEATVDVDGELAAWLTQQRRARRRAASQALTAQRIEAEARGELATARNFADEIVALEPLSEDAHFETIRLRYLAGDRSGALLAFDQLEQMLKHEVGTRPSPASLELLRTIESGGAAATAEPRRAIAAAILRPPRLIGRDQEWAVLEQSWKSRHPTIVLGEGGLGKTRLTTDFATSHGPVLLSGARPSDERVVYSSISRLLRQLPTLDTLAPGVRAELARLLPELGPADPIQTPEQRSRFFNAVATALGDVGNAFEAIVFDDLHFADDASLELLQYVALDSPQRFIFAARPAEISETARELLDAVLQMPGAIQVTLRPLDLSQLQALLESLGLDDLDPVRDAPLLLARTGGNPMFLLESLKAGWRQNAPVDALVTQSASSGVPAVRSPVTQLIERRIARLSSHAVNLARCAAVAAPDFSIELAARVLGMRTMELADPWAELEAAQVLRDGSFAHDLIYESALASVPTAVARQLHAEIAAFLEEKNGEPARIAFHWLAAADERRGLGALLAAAKAAAAAMRPREETDLLARAVDIAERNGENAIAYTAWRDWMVSMRVVDNTRLVDSVYVRLTNLASNDEDRIEAMLDRANDTRYRGDLPNAARLAEEAMNLARDAGLTESEVKATLYLSACVNQLGDTHRAVGMLRSNLPWFATCNEPIAQGVFYNNYACCLDGIDEPDEAQRFHRRCEAIWVELQNHGKAAQGGPNLAISLANCGRMSDALEVLVRAQRHALMLDASSGVGWHVELLTFAVLRDLARYSDAQRVGELVMQSLPQSPPNALAAHNHFALLWLHLGQPARARQALERGRGVTALPFTIARWHHLEGLLQLAVGGKARDSLDKAAELASTAGRTVLQQMIALDLALLLDPEEALARSTEVRDRATAIGYSGVALAATARCARFAAAAGHADEALLNARAALQPRPGVQPSDLYPAELWLDAALGLRAAGAEDEAAAAVQAGVAWINETAARELSEPLLSGFMERNAVNRALLTWPRRPPSKQ